MTLCQKKTVTDSSRHYHWEFDLSQNTFKRRRDVIPTKTQSNEIKIFPVLRRYSERCIKGETGEKSKWRQKTDRKNRRQLSREERERRGKGEGKRTELLKISATRKTVFEVATSDLLPRMYNRSNFFKSYRDFKYNRVREIQVAEVLLKNCNKK